MALTEPDARWPHSEHIGNPECPILRRWTLAGWNPEGRTGFRLYLHHFFSKSDDRDVHDHPCAFFTFCFFGSYEDFQPCEDCAGTGRIRGGPWCREKGVIIVPFVACRDCYGIGSIRQDRVRFGSFRYRPAEHTHRTKSGRFGTWTLVLMLPKSRTWGFWRDGRWWSAADYEDEFGPAMRCE